MRTIDLNAAYQTGKWVPGCGGTEQPFVGLGGVRLLYCWHTGTGEHAYMNLDTDMPIPDDDLHLYLWSHRRDTHA